jgi:hypothetical protein
LAVVTKAVVVQRTANPNAASPRFLVLVAITFTLTSVNVLTLSHLAAIATVHQKMAVHQKTAVHLAIAAKMRVRLLLNAVRPTVTTVAKAVTTPAAKTIAAKLPN